MDIDTLAAQEPQTIDDALDCMEMGLRFFHEAHDRRAIFLRLYHKMTLEVHAAINGCGDYEGRDVFMEPGWVRRLSGHFSTLYFKSLKAPATERAWTLAYETAARPGSSVVENALLGINAHINFDLPRAIAKNLEGDDVGDFMTMQKRKFDHDQVNNLLVRTLNPVQEILAKDYEPGIAAADWLLGQFDERVSEAALGTTASGSGGTRSPTPPPPTRSASRSSTTSWNGSPTASPSGCRARTGCGGPSAPSTRSSSRSAGRPSGRPRRSRSAAASTTRWSSSNRSAK